MFCLSAEPPFACSAGNEGKVAFRPSEWKGLSSRISSEIRQRATFLPEKGFGDGIGRAGGPSATDCRGAENGVRGGTASRSVRVCIPTVRTPGWSRVAPPPPPPLLSKKNACLPATPSSVRFTKGTVFRRVPADIRKRTACSTSKCSVS